MISEEELEDLFGDTETVKEKKKLTDEKHAGELKRRSRFYREVFSKGSTSQEAVDYVLHDLISVARVFENAPREVLERVEGRREIVYRMLAHIELTPGALLRQYVLETQRDYSDE